MVVFSGGNNNGNLAADLNGHINVIVDDVNSLSTNSTLSINNLNTTSTTLLGLINGRITQLSYLNTTSTSLLGLIMDIQLNYQI